MPYRAAIGLLAFSALGWGQQNADRAQFFETRIRPLLANNCYSCHTDKKSGGLRVDSRVALLAGGDSGPAIIPGRPDESLLVRAVSHTSPELKMPLGGEKLKDAQIADLRYWIQAMAAYWPDEGAAKTAPPPTSGAKFTIRPEQRNFWSFQPIINRLCPQSRTLPG
jgi:mono/diheme cytochrome c family protein